VELNFTHLRQREQHWAIVDLIGKACHLAGGELEQIQFLPGHVSIQTTERYLGCKQNRIGIEPKGE
jgi:hypothetical protein